jgi:hypothetical protein
MSDPLPRRDPYQFTAVERLAIAMGRPVPRPLTEAEERELEAKMDAADEEAARFYGSSRESAA